jgi:hypothetical protein
MNDIFVNAKFIEINEVKEVKANTQLLDSIILTLRWKTKK